MYLDLSPVKMWQKRDPLGAETHVLGPKRQACKVSFELPDRGFTFSTSLLISLSSPPPFWLPGLCPKMDFSRSTLRVLARGIYGMPFPSGFRPLSSWSSVSKLGHLLSFQSDPCLSHERTTISISVYLFPPTLDDFHFPRIDVNDTGEISYC